jgi:DNA polymerase
VSLVIPDLIVGIDFETYWDKDYTLKKMSTTEYVRHELFKVQCVAIRTNHEDRAQYYAPSDVHRVLGEFDWSTTAFLAHHAHFDGSILSHHYGIVPRYAYDTLSMARPLHGGKIRNDLDTLSKYYGGRGKIQGVLGETKGIREWSPELLQEAGTYCAQDVDEMWRIFREMLKRYPADELDLIHHTVMCYINPVLVVDKERCKEEHKNEIERKKELFQRVGLDKKILRKRDYFAQLLRYSGVEPPTKISPANGKLTYAFAQTDLEYQSLSGHPNTRVRDLVAARTAAASNLAETRAARLLLHADPWLPLYLAYGRAHTLRWGGGDKNNPQNYPRDGRLRACITARPGFKLVTIDSAQIEARANAWLAGQLDLLDQFRRYDAGDGDADPYKRFAAENVYRKVVEEITGPERFLGKVCILGLGYQMGPPKFQHTCRVGQMGPPMEINDADSERCVYAYRDRFPCITGQWDTFRDLIPLLWGGGTPMAYGPLVFEKGKIWLPNEMFLRYPGLHRRMVEKEDGSVWREWRYNGNEKIYGGLLVENVIQCLARIIVAWQLLQLADHWKLVNLVHDEGVFCVPEDHAEACLKEAEEVFCIPPPWCQDMPVAGEGVISQEYRKP